MSTHKTFPLLETNRLILRGIEPSDASDLHRYYCDRQVTQYLDWFGPASPEHADELIKAWNRDFQQGTFMRWGIALQEGNTLIGTIPMNPVRGPFEWKLPIAIGYELSRKYWNQGLMTEALQAVIRYIFETMDNHRICAEVFPENIASLKVLKKLGFQEEGYLRKHLWHEGLETWNDVITLAILNTDI